MFGRQEPESTKRGRISPALLSEATIQQILYDGVVSTPNAYAPGEESYRCAAVLVPLVVQNDEWHLLFTRRTETLPDHKGQVAFPGGACEQGDEGPADTAKRETLEEIGVLPEHIRVLGYLDKTLSITSFLITPVVATLPWPYPIIPSVEEVSRVFTVPLSWLANPANWEERPFFHPVRGGAHMVIYFAPYDGEIIWGLTARMTLTLLETLKLVQH